MHPDPDSLSGRMHEWTAVQPVDDDDPPYGNSWSSARQYDLHHG